jgi:hypothetical protein
MNQHYQRVSFQLLTATNMKIVVFWDIASCSLVNWLINRAIGHYKPTCNLWGFCGILLSKHRNMGHSSGVVKRQSCISMETAEGANPLSFGHTRIFEMFIFRCQKMCWPACEQINVLTCEKIQTPIRSARMLYQKYFWDFTSSFLEERHNQYLIVYI